MQVAVIGGGIAGLVAAYRLSGTGASVTLFERGERLGGLAGSFELEPGKEIERYYHFLCKGDTAYFEMLDALNLRDRLRWVTTEMGLFYNGRLYTLGDAISLLKFPLLSLADKIRFARTSVGAKLRGAGDWKDLEDIPARDWLVQTYGENTYRMLYEPLLEQKFREYAPRISAAWMWARFHRLGNSRTPILMKERVGYLVGGSQAYIDGIESVLRERGVTIRTRTSVEQVVVENDQARGVRVDGAVLPFDYVISTVPIPHTRELLAGCGGPYFDNLRQLPYIGVMVMLLQLKRRFSKYYWMNVSDARLPLLSGIIEYTNLNPYPQLGGDAILYIPQYLPHDHALYGTPDEELFAKYCDALKTINPQFDPSWVKQYRVHRDRWAQPICETGFSRHIPSIETPIANLFLTDSYQLHPHDRAITFSTELGKKAADLVLEQERAHPQDTRDRAGGASVSLRS